MSENDFDQDAWLDRIGYRGSREPVLETLQGVVKAHGAAISYESIDVLLDRPPSLDLGSLQRKIIAGGRGGYCFEQNILLTEGPFLADVGFGNLAPTAPLRLSPDLEQDTPHETMRFIRMGDELTLQSRLGDRWEHIYRVVLLPRVDAEYEICNWFTASHPDSPYRSNLIAARPGPNRTRITLFNARLNVRHATGEVERRTLAERSEYRDVLANAFGLALSDADLAAALETVARKGAHGAPHPFFA